MRLVHSGFAQSGDWEHTIDVTEAGWRYFLFNLRHYLERHRGVPRVMAWTRRASHAAPDAAWSRLVGPDGLALGGGPNATIHIAGEPHRATVHDTRPAYRSSGALPSLADRLPPLQQWIDALADCVT